MKKISALLLLLILFSAKAQSLNPTYSITNPGSADLFKGGYTFAYATSGTPFNGSLISFGGFSNNYDTQLSSSYYGQNISFRSKNGDSGVWNPWLELATKSSNNFVGPQSISGEHATTNLVLHANNNSNASADLAIWASEPGLTYFGVGIGNNIINYSNGTPMNRIDATRGGSYIRLLDNEINFNLVSNNGVKQTSFNLYANGNASVQGKLEAKEIKVTTTPTADFVFAENYKLPTLENVEKHIKEKQHLPEIASAKEMEKQGVNVGEFQIKLLQKIEELTLYQIDLNKKILNLEKEIKSLKK